jgi:hypothetical protein
VSEVAEEVPGEPAVGVESTVVAPPPPVAGADVKAAEVSETSSPQPVAPVDEVEPTMSQPPMPPQEHDAPEGEARPTSPEIQETGEGSSVAQLPEPEEGKAQTLDLAHFSWAAAFDAVMTPRRTRSPLRATPSSAG